MSMAFAAKLSELRATVTLQGKLIAELRDRVAALEASGTPMRLPAAPPAPAKEVSRAGR